MAGWSVCVLGSAGRGYYKFPSYVALCCTLLDRSTMLSALTCAQGKTRALSRQQAWIALASRFPTNAIDDGFLIGVVRWYAERGMLRVFREAFFIC